MNILYPKEKFLENSRSYLVAGTGLEPASAMGGYETSPFGRDVLLDPFSSFTRFQEPFSGKGGRSVVIKFYMHHLPWPVPFCPTMPQSVVGLETGDQVRCHARVGPGMVL